MSKQTDTPIYDVVRREHGRHAQPAPPMDPATVTGVGATIVRDEPRPARLFGLPIRSFWIWG